ncbi:PIR Superfamily Protein [Plasmodium ovale curtisi]|uniref:PIR Superfamily Protein n=1 Tax=Plasmodium ovale curtisi TaxID=864141 RepID=A0A1A8VKR2_PLAOA|nr:PIR Superfamily Protein [Plasmodium ovale curtisi]
MHLEITTIYNAAYSNCKYKETLYSFKNSREMQNTDGCTGFTNEHLKNETNQDKICEAVILFLRHLKEETDSTYRDNGCKYLYYCSNTFKNYINEMNEQTSDKLVKLTDMYNKLEDFYEIKKSHETEKKCTSGVKDLYAEYLDECRKGYDYDFCDELKNFRKKHNYYVQKVLFCEGEQYFLPPVERFDTVDMTIIPFSLMSVTTLILPILYKFTAFGPWIRRLIGKNENLLKYINEEKNHSLNTSEMENENSEILRYNIVYNSS